MKKISSRTSVMKLAMVVLLALSALPGKAVQYFEDTDQGDLNVEFRKTGSFQEQVETIGYLGNIGDFLKMSAGAVTNLNNFQKQLTNTCPDGFANLQWSAFASFDTPSLTIGTWVFTNGTCWYTRARTNVNVQSKAPTRPPGDDMGFLNTYVYGASDGANQISSSYSTTNSTNNVLIVLESYAQWSGASTPILDNYLTDASGRADFGGNVFNYSVETTNVTAGGTSYCDLYQVYGANSSGETNFIDPISGTGSGAAYYVGFFTLNPNGSMTFTRASVSSPPTPGTITSTVTNGFSPLAVTFTNSASGSITNWVWNYGDGTIITNSTGANVNHTYSTSGTYSVILTVEGPGGSASVTNTAFIVTSPTPKVFVTLNTGKFIISGTNCPIGVQYHFLMTTNLTNSYVNWKPVGTNMFNSAGKFFYTNSTTNLSTFFRLESP